MSDPRDLRRVVELARIAEDAGVAAVMMGEHVVMGPNSAKNGAPENPRDFAGAFNQPPRFPYPGLMPVLGAVAAATSRIQIFAAAVLATLRPPLLIAKELATVDLLAQGRLSVVPTVSWQAEEYAALGIDFHQRGKMLDEHLEIWHRLWTEGSPVSYDGRFYRFSDIYVEPAPHQAGGPEIWVGGRDLSPYIIRRIVRYAKGMFPLRPPGDEQMAELADAMKAAGRDISELKKMAELPIPPFTGSTDVLDLDAAVANAPDMVAKGYTTLVVKPSMFIDDDAQFGDFCRDAVRKLDAAARG
ncbi:LLM class flavin-dependent oxidoreductase [Nocardia carnea]|uniref:LLM class flavin-dependent oxidoreductase n=1 Tax=Nocardia carnea TaxID=37328 RepID=UPI0024541072|nr:LLM class flavin-dependent oxidoreductase [Nocardia carnea]